MLRNHLSCDHCQLWHDVILASRWVDKHLLPRRSQTHAIRHKRSKAPSICLLRGVSFSFQQCIEILRVIKPTTANYFQTHLIHIPFKTWRAKNGDRYKAYSLMAYIATAVQSCVWSPLPENTGYYEVTHVGNIFLTLERKMKHEIFSLLAIVQQKTATFIKGNLALWSYPGIKCN